MTTKKNEMAAVELDNTPVTEMNEGKGGEPVNVEEKAKQILAAKLPVLTEKGLNFERRTGGFFKASLIKVAQTDETGQPLTDADGQIKYKTDEWGRAIEKIARIGIELTDEAGDVRDEYTDAVDAINAKRSAALVADQEKKREKLIEERDAAAKALSEVNNRIAAFETSVFHACKVVEAFDLPVKEKASRAAAVKLAAIEDENAKLRAKLIAAGIDPDA